jgi:neurofibromin 1
LLFLLPDVFEVASNLRDAKSNSIVKKTAFLEGLRKALRNRNEQAAYCLVSLLHACRHFNVEDDAAFVSFALDIQDEVTDAMFRRSPSQTEASALEEDLLTAAFVSLAQLNPANPPEHLLEACLASSAPRAFISSMIHGCGYLARQPDARKYDALFLVAAPFMLDQLQVRTLSPTCCTAGTDFFRSLPMPRMARTEQTWTQMIPIPQRWLAASSSILRRHPTS